MCASNTEISWYVKPDYAALTCLVFIELDHKSPRAGLLCLTPGGKGYRQPSLNDPVQDVYACAMIQMQSAFRHFKKTECHPRRKQTNTSRVSRDTPWKIADTYTTKNIFQK